MNWKSNTKKMFTLYGLMLGNIKNEKEFALIPLLKTINYSINDDKNEKKKRPKIKINKAYEKENSKYTLFTDF
jgi:hypothetical protein